MLPKAVLPLEGETQWTWELTVALWHSSYRRPALDNVDVMLRQPVF